jgi:hypothetical protein
MSEATSKKAFDTRHSSIPIFFPDEVSLVGGKDHIKHPDERGPLDTAVPTEIDPLFRPGRLEQIFKDGFVESIDAQGVIKAITIVRRNGVPTVETGQMRTRGARRANAARKRHCGVANQGDREANTACLAQGFPLIQLPCLGKAAEYTAAVTLQRLLAENHQVHPDDINTALTLMTLLLDQTQNDYKLVGQQVGLTEQRVRDLTRYATVATDKTKEMVAAGRVSLSAAAMLCREEDPEKQNEFLMESLSAGGPPTEKTVIKLMKRGKGKKTAKGVEAMLRKDQVRFEAYIVEQELPKARSDKTAAYLEGVTATLKLVTTGKAGDQRLDAILKKFNGQ